MLRQTQSELESLQQDERVLAQRIDMLQYQIEEIGAAELQDGEEEELREERTRLANAEQLNRLAAEITAALIGLEDDTPSAIDLLGKAERALGQLSRLDGSKASLLGESARDLIPIERTGRRGTGITNRNLEFNPQRFE